jgi:hypothetical protein
MIGWPVRPHPVALAEVAHRCALDRDARGLIQIRGQLLIGPVCSIKPTPLGTAFYPVLDRRCQCGWNAARWSWGPLDGEACKAVLMILREPAPYSRTMHPEILGDGLALTAPTRHQDRLAPITEPSVAGRLEGVFQLLLFRGRQPNPSHPLQPPLIGYLSKRVS